MEQRPEMSTPVVYSGGESNVLGKVFWFLGIKAQLKA
jgi:hypothetical protein